MRYQLVIFDFDGTLAELVSLVQPRHQRRRRPLPLQADRRRTRSELLRAMDARTLMRHLGVPAWKMPFIVRHMRQRKSRELDQTRLFDGVDRMLR